MRLNILMIILHFWGLSIIAQDWEIAPEIWSEPVLLDSNFNIPYHWLESPSLTQNMDTIYFFNSRIHMSYKENNKWVEPTKLSDSVNGFTAMRECSISKNGKRLYVSAWGGYGGWDLYYSDWDDKINDWSPAQNMGASINTSYNDWYVYEISNDSIYVIQEARHPNFYVFDSLKNEWAKIDSFWYHPIGGAEMYGLNITKDMKKMYFGKRRWEKEYSLDLCVTYWNVNNNYWGDVYYLNINSKAVLWQDSQKRGIEYFPWVSPDGKTMIFSSNRDVTLHPDSTDNTPNFYISYLLVDENGDTVTSISNNEKKYGTFNLNQNFPNPFNPGTKISFTLKESGIVKLFVYDVLGRRVSTLVNEFRKKGQYETIFNARDFNISSGTYYYQLIHNGNYKAGKMILTK